MTKDAGSPAGGHLGRRALLGLGLGLLAYVAFAAFHDLRGLGEALAAIPWWAPAAACGLSLANYLVRFPRWQRYLRLVGSRVSGRRSLLIYLAGLSLTVSPGKLGEAIKSWLLREVDGTPVSRSAPIVLAERLTDLFGFLMLIGLFGALGAGGPGRDGVAALALAAGIGLALGLTLEGPRALLLRLGGRLPLLGRRIGSVRAALESSAELLRPREWALPSALATLGWGLECVGCWLIATSALPPDAAAIPSLSLPAVGHAFALAAVAGAVVVLSPGGLGVTEGVLCVLLTAGYRDAGLPDPEAMALSVTLVTRLCTLWFGMVVGWIALGLFRRAARTP